MTVDVPWGIFRILQNQYLIHAVGVGFLKIFLLGLTTVAICVILADGDLAKQHVDLAYIRIYFSVILMPNVPRMVTQQCVSVTRCLALLAVHAKFIDETTNVIILRNKINIVSCCWSKQNITSV